MLINAISGVGRRVPVAVASWLDSAGYSVFSDHETGIDFDDVMDASPRRLDGPHPIDAIRRETLVCGLSHSVCHQACAVAGYRERLRLEGTGYPETLDPRTSERRPLSTMGRMGWARAPVDAIDADLQYGLDALRLQGDACNRECSALSVVTTMRSRLRVREGIARPRKPAKHARKRLRSTLGRIVAIISISCWISFA
jgi:hypothetical protein